MSVSFATRPQSRAASLRADLELALSRAPRDDRAAWCGAVQGALWAYAQMSCSAWAQHSGASDPGAYGEDLLSAALERVAKTMQTIDLSEPDDVLLAMLVRAVKYGSREGGRQALGRGRAQERVRRARRELQSDGSDSTMLREEVAKGRTVRWNSPQHVEALVTNGASVVATWVHPALSAEEEVLAVLEKQHLIRAVHVAAAITGDEASYRCLVDVLCSGGRLRQLDGRAKRHLASALNRLGVELPSAGAA
jgi:hypothetical protein